MAHIDHGFWKRYTPSEPRANIPTSVMFVQRESDQQDWYAYVNPPASNFAAGNIIIAARWEDYANGYVVGPATTDATAIFPPGHIVYEIDDYTGSDPLTDLSNKLYDPATGVFSPLPPLPELDPVPTATETKILGVLDEIMKRLDKLEKK